MRDRVVLIVLLSFLSGFLGAAMAMLVTGNLRIPSFPWSAPVAQRSAVPVPETTPPSSPTALQGTTTNPRYDAAWRKMQAGQLEEAQDDFLQILLTSGPPTDPRAMQGLVRVRRRLAKDDSAVLRRQAATYRRAVAQEDKTGEGYTPAAMDLLAEASLRAANELESAQSGKRQNRGPETASAPTPPRQVPEARELSLNPGSSAVLGKPGPGVPLVASPSTYTVRPGDSLFSIARRFGVTVRALTEQNRLTSDQLHVGQQLRIPAPSPLQGAAAPQATATPPPQAAATPQATGAPAPGAVAPAPVPAPVRLPPLSPTGSFYLVQIGPIVDADRASEIVGELTLGGFVPSTGRREEPQRFRVVSDPLLRAVAERRAAVLAQQGFQSGVRILTGGLAQLDFGAFPSQEGAEAVAKRVRTLGYTAKVAREGGSFYIVTLGPYQQPAVDAISKIIARFAAGIVVTPAP